MCRLARVAYYVSRYSTWGGVVCHGEIALSAHTLQNCHSEASRSASDGERGTPRMLLVPMPPQGILSKHWFDLERKLRISRELFACGSGLSVIVSTRILNRRLQVQLILSHQCARSANKSATIRNGSSRSP